MRKKFIDLVDKYFKKEDKISMEELDIFSVSLKKIEGTKNDYEQILRINSYFNTLPKDKVKEIEDIISKTVEDVQRILRY